VQFVRLFQTALLGNLRGKTADIELSQSEYTAPSRYCNTDVLRINLSPKYLYNLWRGRLFFEYRC